MAIEMRTFDELAAEDIVQSLTETTERVLEDNARLDLRRGVLYDLLLVYHSVLSTQLQAQINDYLNARSLQAVTLDPSLADPDVVDDILSNFRVTRRPGSNAVGEVVVALVDNVTVTVAANAVFVANGLNFRTTQVYTAKAEAGQVVTSGDRLFRQTPDGNYAFTITVEAEDEGTSYLLQKDSLIVPVNLPPGYLTSFAESDFRDGLDAETNDELLNRLQEGIAAKTLSNRVNMNATIREVFPDVLYSSIVGFGDREMLRDKHSIVPLAAGGRADWYLRTREEVLQQTLILPATLVVKGADERGTWQIALTRDTAPGFYEIVNIRLPADVAQSGGFTILSEVRSLDLTDDGISDDFVPDILTQEEGTYTRYQTAIVQFTDSQTNTAALPLGTVQDYAVTVRVMPLIADMQSHVSGRDIRHFGADCLIKAPVPCFVELSFSIEKQAGEADPDLDSIKAGLVKLVNNVGFTGRLYASRLYDVIHNYLYNVTSVSAIDMFGRIRRPDGTMTYLRSPEVLAVPDEPEMMVSPRTVQFFVSATDIAIAIESVVPSE